MSVVPRRFSTFLSRSKWPLTDRVADEYTHLSAGAKPHNCDGTRSRTPYDAGARNGYPFQLAAEDKLGYKWCKWVVRIELSTDPNYQGFWESQGYGNDAEVYPSP